MDRFIGHFEIPPASFQSVAGGTFMILVIVIYDRVFVPFARKYTGHPYGITVLQRIGFGLFLSIVNMVGAAILETKRIAIATENHLLDSLKTPMSVCWMIPQYFILSFSDALAVAGIQQLFYDEVPETMRSLVAAAYISLQGFGTLASNVVISVVQDSSRTGEKWLGGSNLNRAHLDSFYWVLVALCTVNLCIYLLVAKYFVYKQVHVVDLSVNTTDTNEV